MFVIIFIHNEWIWMTVRRAPTYVDLHSTITYSLHQLCDRRFARQLGCSKVEVGRCKLCRKVETNGSEVLYLNPFANSKYLRNNDTIFSLFLFMLCKKTNTMIH